MRAKYIIMSAIAVLVILALALSAVGCFGSGGGTETTTKTTRTTKAGDTSTTATTGTDVGTGTSTVANAELSTFKSKDPFIQQAQPVAASTTTTKASGGSTTTIRTVTTRPPSTGTTRAGGTTTTTRNTGTTIFGQSTTTTVKSTTSTTAPHLHTLKVLSIAQVGGSPAVTFQVDGSVYKDKRAGNVVSTSWGQIKVLEVNVSSKVVTLLQGSETLVLSAGQVVYQ